MKKPKTKPAAVEPINRGVVDVAARTARIAATLDLKGLSDSERAFLATCQRIYRRHTGCTSPFENFFWSLAFSVQCGNWPTPDDVAEELGSFKENFADVVRWAHDFYEAYPAKSTTEASHAN